MNDEPLGAIPSPYDGNPEQPEHERSLRRAAQRTSKAAGDTWQHASKAAGETWEQAKTTANVARRQTEQVLRENPIPTIIGALTLGLAIGWALRYATERDEKELAIKSPLGNVNLGFLSLPFLWPFFKSVRERYEDSSEAVKDGVDRLKKMDVDRYTKPIRKRWKAWTD